MNTEPYVYRLTDEVTGMRYIGVRYAKGCNPADLGKTYFTSSIEVNRLFQASPERFKKQILVRGDREFVILVEKTLLELSGAIESVGYYNRANAKAIHPDDIRSGALKAHSRRSSEMYASIVSKMHSKTTLGQRRRAAKASLDKLTEEQLAAKMACMRAARTPAGKAKSLEAMRQANTPEKLSLAGRKGGRIGGTKACLITNAQRFECSECGMKSSPGPLGMHQSRTGHRGKVRAP